MLRIFLSRLLQGIPVLLVVSAAAFGLFQFIGDPVSQMLPPDASVEDREALTAALGLADPIVQYLRFLENALYATSGCRCGTRRRWRTSSHERLPATVEPRSRGARSPHPRIPMGVFCAARPKSLFSKLFLGGSLRDVAS